MSFSKEVIDKVWSKGRVDSNNDPNLWRKDDCGAWIKKSEYGNQTTYGWNIDHITPQSKGGGDELSNLRPLQWENNTDKSDGRLKCKVISSGVYNVYK